LNKVSVVILNYNGEKLLQQFLPSVVQHSGKAQIIVADNGSTDQSVDYVKFNFPGVDIIRLEQNHGFCGGYNLALQKVESTYYVLLNSDVEVTHGWLTPLIELFEKDSLMAAVQPKILSYHQKDHFEYAGAGGGYLDSFGYPFCRGRLFNYTEKDTGQYNDTREVFWASGACMVIRSDIYHKLGGFDETFFAHMEEIDLCWRIQRSGLKICYCGSSTVYHVGAGTLSRSNPRKTYYNFRNGLSLICKHLPGNQLLYKFPIRLLLDYAAAFKFLVEGHWADAKAVIQAQYDFFRALRNTRISRNELKSYPYTARNIYNGLAPLEYYALGRRKIEVNNPK
jgi:GT2 family glycosyltransferase